MRSSLGLAFVLTLILCAPPAFAENAPKRVAKKILNILKFWDRRQDASELPPPPPPLPPPQFPNHGPILFIGDSQSVGTFGQEFDWQLRALVGTQQVASFGSCGSTPQWWLNGKATTCGSVRHEPGENAVFTQPRTSAPTPLLRELLVKYKSKPEVTIVALGINLYGLSQQHIESTVAETARMIRETPSQCIWIGPTRSRIRAGVTYTKLVQTLDRVATKNGCTFIDSTNFPDENGFPARGGDGLHWDSLGAPGRAMAKTWARKAFARTLEILAWEKPSPTPPEESETSTFEETW